MKKIEKLAENVLQEIITNITDDVFLVIQHNREYMKKYFELSDESSRDTVNQKIGKYLKNRLNLTNLDRSDDPESVLIETYTQHGLPDK
jgi:hypothetical protein